MVYSFVLWVMQDLYHPSHGPLEEALNPEPYGPLEEAGWQTARDQSQG